MKNEKNAVLNFIDVFSGAGGLSCGLEQAGMRCLLGIDIDENSINTFKKNHHFAETHCGPISELTETKLKKLLKGQTIHAVVGGPPCQGFSTAGIGDPNDTRNSLFREFIRLVKATNPYFIVIENVTGLLAKKNESTVKDIFKFFHKMGYILDVQVMSTELFGVPEKRRRTIILGSRINEKIVFPLPDKNIQLTVGDAFKDLTTKDGKIFNHDVKKAKIYSDIDRARIVHIPEGMSVRYEVDEKKHLPKKLRFQVNWAELKENRFRQAKLQRLDSKKPGPTIMTHRTTYYHPTENRFLTQREAAAIQSFPNDFEFTGSMTSQWRQIGNAVPPKLGLAIGKSLLLMHENQKSIVKISKKEAQIEANEAMMEVRKKAFIYNRKSK